MGVHTASLIESCTGESLPVVFDRPFQARLSPVIHGRARGLCDRHEPETGHGSRPHQPAVVR